MTFIFRKSSQCRAFRPGDSTHTRAFPNCRRTKYHRLPPVRVQACPAPARLRSPLSRQGRIEEAEPLDGTFSSSRSLTIDI